MRIFIQAKNTIMKKLLFIPLALGLSFCNCTKSTMAKTNLVIESECPENGTCTIQILKNKQLVVKADEFGSIYHQLTDHIGTSVIHYEYNRLVEEGLQDGHHREEILFEINNEVTALHLTDNELQNTKMLFGRHCYCKGQTGFFKVQKGQLHLENEKESIKVDLDFQISQVPQVFNTVKAQIK